MKKENVLELFFDDLHESAKKKVLKFYKIKSLKEANLNITPLCVLCLD